MTTLVRVKRKHTDDPVEALVLSCKRAKTGPTSGGGGAKSTASSKSLSTEVKNVFRFAGTVAQKDQALPSHIEDAIQRGQLQYKTKGNITAPQIKAKQQQKQTSLNNRYRMVAKHRGIELQKENTIVSNTDLETDKPKKKASLRKKIVRRLSTKSAAKENPMRTEKSGACSIVEDEAQRLFNIYEVVHENLDDILSNKPAKLASIDDEDDDDAIMCNNVKMLREKLTISDGDTHRQETVEYVYDLYYAESSEFDFNTEHIVLGLDPYCISETTLVADEDEGNDYDQYEDEDSNDENNWKNDYPDEDPDYFNQRHTDMFDEYLDDYRYGDMSSDDDAFNEYSDSRRRRIMNYSNEVQNGADSDELEMYG